MIGPWSSLWVGEDIEYEVRAGCEGINIIHIPQNFVYIRRSFQQNQLSNYSLQRNIEGTEYKVLVAKHIKELHFCHDKTIRTRMIEILVNQSIFLFDQGKIHLAKRCLGSAKSLSQRNLVLPLFDVLYSHFPEKFLPCLCQEITELSHPQNNLFTNFL